MAVVLNLKIKTVLYRRDSGLKCCTLMTEGSNILSNSLQIQENGFVTLM